MNKSKSAAKAAVPPPTRVITSLDEIAGLCARPIKIPFIYAGQNCELETRHLEPFEAELLKLQLDEILPPLIKGKTEAEDRFDYNNLDYLKKKTRIEREVRAQAIFWATDAVQKKRPELIESMYRPEGRREIVEFVQGKPGQRGLFTEDVLEIIYVAITQPDLTISEQVNFTSPGG